jgi:hypothetical protein
MSSTLHGSNKKNILQHADNGLKVQCLEQLPTPIFHLDALQVHMQYLEATNRSHPKVRIMGRGVGIQIH